MQPDMVCTGWINGVPEWLGGTGLEWIHCCQAHDVSTEPWLVADLELAACVAAAGFGWMALIMLAGLATLGVVYRTVVRWWRQEEQGP